MGQRSSHISFHATASQRFPQVFKKPKVAVLSTGDEVVEPHTTNLGPGQIRDANRSMLLAAVRAAGGEPLDLGIARDTAHAVEGCFDLALAAGVNVLITTGEGLPWEREDELHARDSLGGLRRSFRL